MSFALSFDEFRTESERFQHLTNPADHSSLLYITVTQSLAISISGARP